MEKKKKQVQATTETKKVKTKRIKQKTERVLSTESLYTFRKNHQKKRKNRKRLKLPKDPVINAKMLTDNGLAQLGNIVEIKDARFGVIYGKGTKMDNEAGRCAVILIDMQDAYFNEKSNIVLERVG